jgi:multiple antibiotic resistance protein
MQANSLNPFEIFTLFFVMLGPLKILGPFAQRTRDIPDPGRIAWHAFVLATLGAITGGFLGTLLLDKWHVSFPALTLGGGIIFFLVAVQQLLAQYRPRGSTASQADEPLPASPLAAALQLVFPIVLTPYGIAAVIALLARSDSNTRTVSILVMLVLIMVINFLAMLFARRILVGIVPVLLQLLGAVMAILQLALSIQFILWGLYGLHILPEQ